MENIITKELSKRYELENEGLRRGANVILKYDHPIIEENPNLEKYLGKVVVVERLGLEFFVCYVVNENNTLEFLNATLPYTLIDRVLDMDLTVAECNRLLELLGKSVLLKSNGEKYVIGAIDLADDCGGNIVLVKEDDLFAINSIDSNWDNFRDYYNYEISKGRMIVLEGLTFSEYDWYIEEEIEVIVNKNNQTKEKEEIENKKEESVVMYKVVIKRNEGKVDVVIKVKEEELHQFLVTLVDRYNNSKEGDMILVRDNIIFSNEVVSVDVIKEY